MKKTNMKTGVLALVLLIASCGEKQSNQETQVSSPQSTEQTKENDTGIAEVNFSDKMTETLFNRYQNVRTALIDSDADAVQMAARKLAVSISKEHENMLAIVKKLAEESNIERQRALFSELTDQVEPILKEAISTGTLYKQFCPMAFQGKGGYWISNREEIRNPYYGQKMLTCGKVTEEIQ